MRVAVITTLFSREPRNPNLVTDLVDEFVAQGHQVSVVWTDWSGTQPDGDEILPSGARLLSVRPFEPTWLPGVFRKAAKWALTSAVSRGRVERWLTDAPVDLVVGFSPAIIGRGWISRLKKRTGARAYLIQWDFFPVHHAEIGALPGGSWGRRLAEVMERAAIADYDVIGMMSPANIEFFRKYHPSLAGRRLEVLPVWGKADPIPVADRQETRARLGLPLDRLLVIFGGQLTAGRGLNEILLLAERVRVSLPQVGLIVIGGGPLFEPLRQEIARRRLDNLFLLRRAVREDYLKLLGACDIALVVTVPGVSVPTFPSKTIDYLRAGLPILASTESTTDYGVIMQEEAKAGLCSTAGDLDALERNLKHLLEAPTLREDFGRNGRVYFRERMTVSLICRQIAGHARSRPSETPAWTSI